MSLDEDRLDIVDEKTGGDEGLGEKEDEQLRVKEDDRIIGPSSAMSGISTSRSILGPVPGSFKHVDGEFKNAGWVGLGLVMFGMRGKRR